MGRSDDKLDSSLDDRKKRKKHKARDDDSDDDSEDSQSRKNKKSSKKRHSRKHDKKKTKKRKRYSSSSESSSSESEDSEDKSYSDKKVANERLLAKLSARGETLEERKERRAQKRAAQISAKFGYTAEDNPFNDPNLHEKFTWKKREEKAFPETDKKAEDALDEIEKVRKRRKDREIQAQEMERIRAEESRMKELENYDEWARKEEEFHLQQQRQRSAIRLVEGREKPIDVLAKNVLIFGLSEEEKESRATVKYKEKFNALDALDNLEAELDEPQALLKILKLSELKELLVDIDAFRALEREADLSANAKSRIVDNPVLRYWDNLFLVAQDEIKFMETGGRHGSHAKMTTDVQSIFKGQTPSDLMRMQSEINEKLRQHGALSSDGAFDRQYWTDVRDQLSVYNAKAELSDLHSQMLVRQLERLEKRKEELSTKPPPKDDVDEQEQASHAPDNVPPNFGDLEEELGLSEEIALQSSKYSWQDKYRPRKPRYFNRVKTGYDWNKYNQTHYDKDTPPPKIVQGYKFNVFYPDLIDPTKTPQFFLEPADSDEFCIIRFHAGPPYEDVAFKIINREWNKSRKQGFKSTFERGVLSLYFNFKTHWYRR